MNEGKRKKSEEIILSMLHGMWQSRCLSVLVGLGIPEILCNSNKPSLHVDEIAREADCSTSDQLYPVIRVLAQWGIGEELAGKQFRKNNAMELLRKDQGPSLGSMLAYFCSDENWAAMLALPEAVKTGKPGFLLEHGMTHFEYMNCPNKPYATVKTRAGCSEHLIGSKERRKEYVCIYDEAIEKLTHLQISHGSFASKNIYSIFPWHSCQRLMDIGGSNGTFLLSIMKLPGCEHIHGILDELPSTIADAEKAMQKEENEKVRNRLTFLTHDCFQPFPMLAPIDTIICKNFITILSFENVSLMLKNCKPLFPKDGGRFLVICSSIPPEHGDTTKNIAANNLQPGFLSVIHTMTLQPTQARMRTCMSDWIEFLEAVSRQVGYKLTNIYDTEFGGVTIFELAPGLV